MKKKRNKLVNIFKIGVLLFGVSLFLWNCENDNEINDLYDVSVNKKLDYTLKKIGYSELITDQEIKKSLPKIQQRFSKNKKQNIQSKNAVEISESFTIITDSIHKVITKNVITWAFKIKTPVLKNSDFENFLIKKKNQKFSYFLVSYEKGYDTKYKNVSLYPIPEESLSLENLNLPSIAGANIEDPEEGGGGGGGGNMGCQGILVYDNCSSGGSADGHHPALQLDGVSYCSGSPLLYVDFSHCPDVDPIAPDNSNPNTDNTNNQNNGGSSSSGGSTITSPVTLECDNCSNSLISQLNLTNQNQIDWVNDANNIQKVTNIFNFGSANQWSNEAKNFALEIIKAKQSNNYTNLFKLTIFTQNPYNVWKSLSQAEKDLIKQYWSEAYHIFKNRKVAEDATKQKFNKNGLNDKSDAFRHAYYNIINTKVVGIDIAKLFSDAHESETPNRLIKEKEMDLFNNNVGQQSLLGNSNLSLTQLADLIYQKILNGDLRYLKPINYNDPNFTYTHGITANTLLTPTNQ